MAKREQISVTVNPELRAALEQAAAAENRSVSNLVKATLAKAFDVPAQDRHTHQQHAA